MKSISLFIAVIVTFISLGCFSVNFFKNSDNMPLSAMGKIFAQADSVYTSKYGSLPDSTDYIRALNEVFINKFHHDFARYAFADNYILYLFSKLTDDKHRGVVIPEHIAAFDHGICSQQAILFIEMAKLKGFRARPVRTNRHFICEVYAKGGWHLIDTDLKLSLLNAAYLPAATELKQNPTLLDTFYLDKIKYSNKALAATFFDKVEPGPEKGFAAKNLKLLHEATFFLSHYLWAICWAIVVLLYRYRIKSVFKSKTHKTQKLATYEL